MHSLEHNGKALAVCLSFTNGYVELFELLRHLIHAGMEGGFGPL